MKLAAKVMLVLLTTVIVFTALASYVSVRAIYNDFQTQQQALAQQLADELHDRLESAWRQQGLTGVLHVLNERVPSQGGSLRARWVWFERSAPASQRPQTDANAWNRLRSGEIISVMSTNPAGQTQLHTYLPLPLVNAPWRGGLEITESLEIVENHMRRTVWLALATIGSLAVVATAISYWAGLHWVAQPLEQLIAKTRRIGAGDFSQPLQLAGDDELTQLATALNDMCVQLDHQQQTIQAESAQRVAVLDQLRHADRLKTVGRLAAGLAHELGTPLNVISGRAGLIASEKLGPAETLASARTIKTEADRITNIVRHLLDFARQRPPQRKPTDLRHLIDRTLELLQPLAAKQNIQLSADNLADPLPALVDEGQIEQVLTNMIMNSVQAMPQGGEIQVSAQSVVQAAPGDAPGPLRPCLCLAVTDNGPGIPAEIRDQLFEPFFTTKDVGEGTGLGLSIAYGIVQEHGGWIHVVSDPGQGARFEIYLPQGEMT